MDEFHNQLTSTLRRKADSVDTTELPHLPSYAHHKTVGREERPRAVGALAALALVAVAMVGVSVLVLAQSTGDEEVAPASESDVDGQPAEDPVEEPAEDPSDGTAEADDSGPIGNPDGTDLPGARIGGDAQRRLDTEQSTRLGEEARAILPGYSVVETYEWTFDGETVSVFAELEAEGGQLAKLAVYNEPNPAHEELLAAAPSLTRTGTSWTVTDLTPDGRQVVLILMERPDTRTDEAGQLPELVDAEAVTSEISNLADRLD